VGEAASREIDQAAEILARGGVVVYPTETLYGLGVDAESGPALERLVALKGREGGKPTSILVDSRAMLDAWVLRIPEYAERLMSKLWPGALTLALPAKPHVSKRLTGEGGSIGVRISSHSTAQRLVTRLGRAVTATSANPRGLAPPSEIIAARRYFESKVDAYLDGGQLDGGPGSTIIDASGDRPLLLREGALAAEAIEEAAEIRLVRQVRR
jgi:L-threonylcarbamoyladenylate synthase